MSERASPRLILHIGQHKTGSKALQSFCAANAKALARAGLCYPPAPGPRDQPLAYARSHFRLYGALRRGEDARDLLSRFETERRRAGAACLLLSAEDLFDMETAHSTVHSEERVETAARALAGHAAALGLDARVVVYLRRQDHLLSAHYAQFIKGSTTNDVGFEEFARAFEPRLEARRILGHWEAAFGRERILVRAYEPARLAGGIVSDFFGHVLEVGIPDGCGAAPDDVEAVNRTPPREVIEYIRGLNRLSQSGVRVPSREAVIEAARDFSEGREGIDAWLSPAARRELLDRHAVGNDAIAEDFLPPASRPLFHEPPPGGDGAWSPYPGLTPEVTAQIARAVEEIEARIGRR